MNWQDFVSVLDVAPEPSDEMLISRIREWRNYELLASDWTQLPDIEVNKVDVAAWRVYRQELRDMLDAGIPVKQIVFPVRPT